MCCIIFPFIERVLQTPLLSLVVDSPQIMSEKENDQIIPYVHNPNNMLVSWYPSAPL